MTICDNTSYKNSYQSLVVGSFQKLYTLLKNSKTAFNELSKKIKLLVIDEAHKVIAPTYKEVTKALIGKETKLVGLTATPGRGIDNISQNKQLSQFFFNKILSIPTPEGTSAITYLRRKRILAKLEAERLISRRTYRLTPSQRQYLANFFDFPPGFLNAIAADDIRNIEIIKRLDNECKKGCRALFFACSIEHSKFICSMLLFLGHSAAHIDGSTDKRLRKQYLEDFKAGEIKVLCNYGVLSTGSFRNQHDSALLVHALRASTNTRVISKITLCVDFGKNPIRYAQYPGNYNIFLIRTPCGVITVKAP